MTVLLPQAYQAVRDSPTPEIWHRGSASQPTHSLPGREEIEKQCPELEKQCPHGQISKHRGFERLSPAACYVQKLQPQMLLALLADFSLVTQQQP